VGPSVLQRKTVEGPLVDVGPAGTNNPFWNEKDGTPPTKGKGNGAGLDATPAAWDAIGISKGDPARGKVKVDFELFAREGNHRSTLGPTFRAKRREIGPGLRSDRTLADLLGEVSHAARRVTPVSSLAR
jgi:hypothetical protein